MGSETASDDIDVDVVKKVHLAVTHLLTLGCVPDMHGLGVHVEAL